MYIGLLLILLVCAALLTARGIRGRSRPQLVGGFALAAFTIAFFAVLGLWGDVLWFQVQGYGQRIWTELLAKLVLGVAGLVAGALFVLLPTFTLRGWRGHVRTAAVALGGVIGGLWGIGNWEVILRWYHRVETGTIEPILGRDTGFYLFTLPFFDALSALVVPLSIVALGAAALGIFLDQAEGTVKVADPTTHPDQGAHSALYASAAALLVSLAWTQFLDRYHLLNSAWGAVNGAGWTDVHVRLPAYNIVAAVLVLGAIAILVGPVRRRLVALTERLRSRGRGGPIPLYPVGAVAAVAVVVWFLGLNVAPGLFQWLRVEPNEVTLESPYISNNIRFTREGFRLHEVEEHEYPAEIEFTRRTVEENPQVFRNIRLWDWRALEAVYKQFQEIRLYYEFSDVDIDRYRFADEYREVMVSARELELRNLPPESRTFVNERFKYTHGYGVTMATVNEFTAQGLPHMLVKDIPPESKHEELAVDRPEIYYGELTTSPAIVNSEEKEFDFPSGEKNQYVHYQGTGGVPLDNLWRQFLFGWKFDGTRLLFSGYPREESRIQFRREVRERVQALAPFLQCDDDPYVIVVHGRLKWILDCYTTSSYYPYSEPFFSGELIEYRNGAGTRRLRTKAGLRLRGVNYIRNSVKAVVDAYDGTVDLYVFEPEDPLIQVWNRIFPELLQPADAMDAAVRAHVRYPEDMLLVQGLVYAKYHMTNPTVFYNQEDLWIRATEKYYDSVQPVEPYYVMWELPESDEPQFSLILPFTPKNRQVLVGWIAGLCDGEDYGRFLAYKFPTERRVIGPQQVETKIDQDSYLSGQLTLWDQRGSNVIRGNVLAIPIGNTLLYVEPIYLQAETAAYPELRLVAVMHEDELSYARSFEEALEGLFGEGAPAAGLEPRPGAPARVPWRTSARGADRAFRQYLDALGQRNYPRAAAMLDSLERALEELRRSAEEGDRRTENGAGGEEASLERGPSARLWARGASEWSFAPDRSIRGGEGTPAFSPRSPL